MNLALISNLVCRGENGVFFGVVLTMVGNAADHRGMHC